MYLRYKKKYIKAKTNYFGASVWRILYEYKESDQTLGYPETLIVFRQMMKNAELGKLSDQNIQSIKNDFFYAFDSKMADRIKAFMNLENSEMPSIKVLFPEGYKDFPFFEELDKKENLFILVEEYQKVFDLVEPSKEITLKFKVKLNDSILYIAQKIIDHLDLNGKRDPSGVPLRYLSIVNTLNALKAISFVEDKSITSILKELEISRSHRLSYLSKN